MCLACNREFQEDIQKCPHDGTALISLKTEDDWLGKTLGDRYEITKMLGKGGMGIVYLARHTQMDRWVAVKMLQAELAQDELSVKRFQQEAKAASCLNHPHLVTLHDYGIAPTDQPYLVMEYLEGRSLLEVIKRQGPLNAQRAVKIFSEVADGLAHAHHQGIVHRDLKPSNIILVDQEGDPEFVKVVDFGLAKLMPWSGKESQHLTKTGEVFGSPIYMSPEQCMGRELRPTSDIYSLGVTLFESLTGKPPFRGANSIATASMHMSQPAPSFTDVRPDLELPAALEKVVMTTLAKDPGARFEDMKEFKDALQSSMSGRASQTSISRPGAAMGSTVAIPVMKQEQDRMRQSLSLKGAAIDDKNKGNKKPWLVAVAAVLTIGLAAAGILALVNGGTNVDGEIWMVSGTPAHASMVVKSGDKLVRVAIPESFFQYCTQKGQNGIEARIGQHIVLKFNRNSQLSAEPEMGAVNEEVAKNYSALVTMLEKHADAKPIEAVNIEDVRDKFEKTFKNIVTPDAVGWKGGTGLHDVYRTINGIVVESVSGTTVHFLLNKRYYCAIGGGKEEIPEEGIVEIDMENNGCTGISPANDKRWQKATGLQ